MTGECCGLVLATGECCELVLVTGECCGLVLATGECCELVLATGELCIRVVTIATGYKVVLLYANNDGNIKSNMSFANILQYSNSLISFSLVKNIPTILVIFILYVIPK